MSNIFDGTHLFNWQANAVDGGNVDAMIADAKKLGTTGVLLKCANGSLAGDPVSQQFMADFKRLAPAFKAAGFRVGAWIYQYLTDVAGEVDACVQAIEAGAEYIVLDAEVDVSVLNEDGKTRTPKTAEVQEFGRLFRAKYPNFPVGLSSFAIASSHPEVPFDAYNEFVNFMMPQIYWATMDWDVAVAFNASIASYKRFGKPIAPTGQAYDDPEQKVVCNPADMVRFVQICKQAGYTGISWWDWQSASATQLATIAANIIAPTVAPTPSPVPAPQPSAPTQPVQQTSPTPAQPEVPTVPAKDVAADFWGAKFIDWALKEGIMHNDTAGNFNPNEPLTRAQAAALLYNNEHRAN